MHALSLARRFAVVWAGAALVLWPQASRAGKPEEVKFETADKVELRGTFYPGAKDKPCVIFVHKLGGNRQQGGWEKLAKALNNKDYAVLMFDLRGHGDSTNVAAEFWASAVAPNARLIRGASPAKDKISHKDFLTTYHPYLANDLAAAKRYLDKQNDAMACNSSDLVVIGAEDGAALGALWIASEWMRRPMVKNAFQKWVVDYTAKPAGEEVAAGVWLSMPKTLNGASVSNWIGNPPIRDKVPMVFFYGKGDDKSASSAESLYNHMKRAKKKLELTVTRPKEGKLKGSDLLGKDSLKTEEDITNYLEKVMEKRGATPWSSKDVKSGPPLYRVPVELLR